MSTDETQKQERLADLNNQLAQLQSDLEQEVHLDQETIKVIKTRIAKLEEEIQELEG